MKNKKVKPVKSVKSRDTKLIAPKPVNSPRPVSDLSVTVYIKDKSYKIFSGDGKQRIRWLIDVVLHKFDKHFALESGILYILI